MLSQPTYVTSSVDSYRDRQAYKVGFLLIIVGTLSILFGGVELIVRTNNIIYGISYYGVVCGGLVSTKY